MTFAKKPRRSNKGVPVEIVRGGDIGTLSTYHRREFLEERLKKKASGKIVNQTEKWVVQRDKPKRQSNQGLHQGTQEDRELVSIKRD